MSNDGYCFSCSESFDECECDEPETYSNEWPHCPHCGHKQNKDDPTRQYFEDGNFELECDECGKPFDVEVYVSFSYTCTREVNCE